MISSRHLKGDVGPILYCLTVVLSHKPVQYEVLDYTRNICFDAGGKMYCKAGTAVSANWRFTRLCLKIWIKPRGRNCRQDVARGWCGSGERGRDHPGDLPQYSAHWIQYGVLCSGRAWYQGGEEVGEIERDGTIFHTFDNLHLQGELFLLGCPDNWTTRRGPVLVW